MRKQTPIGREDSQRPPLRLGRVVATPGALRALAESGESLDAFLERHVRGDWGDVCDEDKKRNDESLAHEYDVDLRTRVLSAYTTGKGERLWLISEADRSATVLLLPEEY